MDTDGQRAFIRREIFSMTLSASTQRAGVYKAKTPEKARKPVHSTLRCMLEELAMEYTRPVTEEVHLQNIQRLVTVLTDRHSDVLANGGLRIGPAQKALNLYLKYLWCMGEIPEPPHCPIDANVLRKVPGCAGVRWTRLKTIEEYRGVIKKARDVASQEGVSLPVWELRLFNEEVAER